MFLNGKLATLYRCKMSCVLCLESSLGSIESILINSPKAQKLDLLFIIERHFSWIKLDVSHNEESIICQRCWHAVYSFHKFYLRVENVHKLLESEIKAVEACIFVEPEVTITVAKPVERDVLETKHIKVEIDTLAKSVSQLKRRRGRPRKKTLQEDATIKEESFDVPKNADVSGEEVLEIPSIKDETLNEDIKLRACYVTNYSLAKTIDNKHISNGENKKTLNREHSKQKKMFKYSKKMLVTRECDEYIASHFKLSCCLCEVPMEDFNVLRTHFRMEHECPAFVKCCGKKIFKRCFLVDHLRTHEDPACYKCPHCNKISASRRALNMHLKYHQDSQERKYECKICFKKFTKQAVCERHMLLVHLPEEKKTVSCSECGKAFANEYLMTQHMKLMHLNTYARICDICGKSVVGRAALRRHLEEHSGVSPAMQQCNLCGAKFSTERGLSRHMKNIHSEENRQPQTCHICSKVLSSVKAYKCHINNIHKKEPQHVCSLCGKAFRRPLHLKEHMTTHTGETLYTCPYCPETFSSYARIYCHTKKVHQNEYEEKHMVRKRKPQVTTNLLFYDSICNTQNDKYNT